MSKQTETVWVAKLYMKTHEGIYHTNPDCIQLDDCETITEKSLNVLHNDMRECLVCKRGGRQGTEEIKTCPFCETKVKRLPNHLPQCPEK